MLPRTMGIVLYLKGFGRGGGGGVVGDDFWVGGGGGGLRVGFLLRERMLVEVLI